MAQTNLAYKTQHEASPRLSAFMSDYARKADKTPPLWYRDSVQLKLLLEVAWENVSADWREELRAAIQAHDIEKLKALAKTASDLGSDMLDELGDTPETIFSKLGTKAMRFWKGEAVNLGIEAAGISAKFRAQIAEAQGAQIKEFVRQFPERILEPEIQRQINYLTDTEFPDANLIETLTERLTEFTDTPAYFEKLSDTAIARNWHASGILHADRNGIVTGQIVGPLDAKTCDVCRNMLGSHVEIADAKAKIEADLMIEDIEEYVQAWKFPRLADVDNMSREDLQAKNYLPPFHCGCRHAIAWLYERE